MTNDTNNSAAQALPVRIIGSSLAVSALGFGAMGMSEFYGPSDDIASIKLLHEVAERGVTLIDTADLYGRGHNELLIGEFLRARRTLYNAGGLKIATKCGIERTTGGTPPRRINNSPEYIRSCCEASLKRLDVDCIDLYYIHRVDPAIPIEDTMDCLAGLVQEGKIAQVGLCEVSANTLGRAHRIHPVAALQTEYSLWSREVEDEILPMTQALGIGFIAYSPLGRGFLTGCLTQTDTLAEGDFRRANPRFQGDNMIHNLILLDTMRDMAARYGATPGQVALCWLLAQGDNIVPIPGTRRSAYLAENLGAASLTLASADLALLSETMTPHAVHGARYSSEGMQGINA
ncbi:aldo/keto reductase [Solimicrobium silvestre]|uniref:Putative oxidoreductases (Related to aryl-alcohol dehydrogenases) n=1 Tax=Solimicrobium silvestre TaxID=2099400 RepID=A0A2S9GZJ0_9BURK|nr:aldo/keto reductase [Solimicrobium silvestre]PRC93123.1 putative oxidoreductases (related to aryl-alcohol dehydrogenases) [Solimicrobium silvestre]